MDGGAVGRKLFWRRERVVKPELATSWGLQAWRFRSGAKNTTAASHASISLWLKRSLPFPDQCLFASAEESGILSQRLRINKFGHEITQWCNRVRLCGSLRPLFFCPFFCISSSSSGTHTLSTRSVRLTNFGRTPSFYFKMLFEVRIANSNRTITLRHPVLVITRRTGLGLIIRENFSVKIASWNKQAGLTA